MSNMEMPRPNDPHIMGLRLPMRSRKKVGYSDPMKNLCYFSHTIPYPLIESRRLFRCGGGDSPPRTTGPVDLHEVDNATEEE